jgi:hypothetical protein
VLACGWPQHPLLSLQQAPASTPIAELPSKISSLLPLIDQWPTQVQQILTSFPSLRQDYLVEEPSPDHLVATGDMSAHLNRVALENFHRSQHHSHSRRAHTVMQHVHQLAVAVRCFNPVKPILSHLCLSLLTPFIGHTFCFCSMWQT